MKVMLFIYWYILFQAFSVAKLGCSCILPITQTENYLYYLFRITLQAQTICIVKLIETVGMKMYHAKLKIT